MEANKIGFFLHVLIEDPIIKKQSTKLRRNKCDQLNDLELRKEFLNHEKYQSKIRLIKLTILKLKLLFIKIYYKYTIYFCDKVHNLGEDTGNPNVK